MALFNKLFSKSSDNDNPLAWNSLVDDKSIHAVKENSHHKTQLIFKHSTRCGISRMTLKSFEKMLLEDDYSIDFHYLDLLNYRDLSNQISQEFSVHHESPQVLIIKNETCVFTASHYDITNIELQKFC